MTLTTLVTNQVNLVQMIFITLVTKHINLLVKFCCLIFSLKSDWCITVVQLLCKVPPHGIHPMSLRPCTTVAQQLYKNHFSFSLNINALNNKITNNICGRKENK
jgi:hypothetical protein